MKKTLTIILLVISLSGFSQIENKINNQKIEAFNRYYQTHYTGIIDDKFKFSMTLNDDKYYKDECGDGDHWGMYSTKVHGTYNYDKKKEVIDLIGTQFSWDGTDSLNLTEITNEEVTGKFTLKCTDGYYEGTWLNKKTNKKLPVKLKLQKHDTYSSFQIRFKECEAFLNLDPQEQMSVAFNVEINNKRYLFLEGQKPTCLYYKCRGSCCGGESLIWKLFEIDKICNVKNLGEYETGCDDGTLKVSDFRNQIEKFRKNNTAKIDFKITELDENTTRLFIDRVNLEKGLQIEESEKEEN